MQAATIPRSTAYRHGRAAPYVVPPGRWEDDRVHQLVEDFLGSVMRHRSERMQRPSIGWPRVERPYSPHRVRGPIRLDARRWGNGTPPL